MGLRRGVCGMSAFNPKKVIPHSSLGDKQRLFMWCMSEFLDYAYNYEDLALTAGDFARKDNRDHMPSSLHYDRLAADLNVFIFTVEGTWDYIESYDEAPGVWNRLGNYWKSLHPLCRWGGDFETRDLNHFSITAWGRK